MYFNPDFYRRLGWTKAEIRQIENSLPAWEEIYHSRVKVRLRIK